MLVQSKRPTEVEWSDHFKWTLHTCTHALSNCNQLLLQLEVNYIQLHELVGSLQAIDQTMFAQNLIYYTLSILF